jgi:alpha-glucosidase
MQHDWLPDQIVYQIFPDRFAVGGGLSPEQKMRSPAYPPGVHRKAWHDRPEQPPHGRDFFGGDLPGIFEKIEYLHALGVTCVYLTPIFHASSNHKYDTIDFHAVDPMFGTLADFDRLLAALHARGMRLVLDAVFNHVGDHHPWYAGRHRDPKLAGYFLKIDGREQFWRGHRHLPELDVDNPELEEFLWRGRDSVVRWWLDRGIDGWRFDTAPDLGLPFIRRLAAAIRPAYPDRVMWGEVTNFPGADWTGPDRYDGVMNYYCRTAVHGFADGGLTAREAGESLAEYVREMGLPAALRSLLILSSHDTPRLMTGLHDDEARVRLAMTLQFALPGIPMIYYGEENGMAGGADPDNRRPMIWEPHGWRHGIREHLLRLTELRRRRPEWRRGGFTDLTARIDGKVLAFMRTGAQPGEFTLVAANATDRPVTARLVVPYAHLYDGVRLVDLLGHGRHFTALGGRVDVEVPPKTALALAPDGRCIEGFHFYKPRNRLG